MLAKFKQFQSLKNWIETNLNRIQISRALFCLHFSIRWFETHAAWFFASRARTGKSWLSETVCDQVSIDLYAYWNEIRLVVYPL